MNIHLPPILTGWWFGTMEFYDFPYGNFIIPTDELIFFRGVGKPPSSIRRVWKLQMDISSIIGISISWRPKITENLWNIMATSWE